MAEEKLQVDQYYPGGVVQQSLDWMVQHQNKEPSNISPAGATGPDKGWLQINNIIVNWGISLVDLRGVTVEFARPYVDYIPSVVATGHSGEPLLIIASKTGFFVRCDVSSPIVHWLAIGS